MKRIFFITFFLGLISSIFEYIIKKSIVILTNPSFQHFLFFFTIGGILYLSIEKLNKSKTRFKSFLTYCGIFFPTLMILATIIFEFNLIHNIPLSNYNHILLDFSSMLNGFLIAYIIKFGSIITQIKNPN